MSKTVSKRKGWPKVGTLRKGQKGSYIKLEENVTILVDGKPVDMNTGRIVRLEDPRSTVERLLDKGVITEAEADSRLEKLSELSWLKYDLIVAPNKTE